MKPTIDGHLGVDIQALMGALPISGLEPKCLASIGVDQITGLQREYPTERPYQEWRRWFV